jgi:ribosomal protein L9
MDRKEKRRILKQTYDEEWQKQAKKYEEEGLGQELERVRQKANDDAKRRYGAFTKEEVIKNKKVKKEKIEKRQEHLDSMIDTLIGKK